MSTKRATPREGGRSESRETKSRTTPPKDRSSPSSARVVHNPFGTGQFDGHDTASVMAEVSGLRAKLQAKERDNDRLHGEVERLAARLDEADDVRDKCSSIEAENDLLRKSVAELNTSMTHLRRQLEEANHERTRAEVAATTSLSALVETSADLRGAETDRDVAKREVINLRSEMTQTVSSLDRRLLATIRERDNAKAALLAKSDELRLMRERAHAFDASASREPREMNALKGEIDRLTEAAARTSRQHTDRVGMLQQQMDAARSDVLSVRQDSMHEQQVLRDRVNAIRQERDVAQAALATLEGEIEALKRRREEDLESYARQCDATVRRNRGVFVSRESQLTERVHLLDGEVAVWRAHIAELEHAAQTHDVQAIAQIRNESAEQLSELEKRLTRRIKEAERRAEGAEAETETTRAASRADGAPIAEATVQLQRLRTAHETLVAQCSAHGFPGGADYLKDLMRTCNGVQ